MVLLSDLVHQLGYVWHMLQMVTQCIQHIFDNVQQTPLASTRNCCPAVQTHPLVERWIAGDMSDTLRKDCEAECKHQDNGDRMCGDMAESLVR